MPQKRKLPSVSNHVGNKKARLSFAGEQFSDPRAIMDQQEDAELKQKSEKHPKQFRSGVKHADTRSSVGSKQTIIKKKKVQSTASLSSENQTMKLSKSHKTAPSQVKQRSDFQKLSNKGKRSDHSIKPNAASNGKLGKPVKKRIKEDKQIKKERNRTSSDEESDYASHFSSSSDSGDLSQQTSHSDRAAQRDRRRARAERLQRTLFVGNLPPQVSRKRLKQLFNKVLRSDDRCLEADCHVESVRFRGVVPPTGGLGKLARKLAVVQGELSAGVSKNLLAYVVLSSKVGIRTALTLNGRWLQSGPLPDQSIGEDAEARIEHTEQNGPTTTTTSDGRFIRVDSATAHLSTIKPQHCVFLGNLAFDVQEDEVRNALSRFGEITNVRLIRDRETGAVKGIGYVQFEDPAAVSLAIRASESISVRDRPVRVQECKPFGDDSTGSGNNKRASWKPKVTGTKIKLDKSRPKPASAGSPASSGKLYHKLDHIGRAKGITLPSNLHGSMRERYLAKRLAKKRKRQIRRQRNEEQQAHASALAEEMKAKQKALKLKHRKKARKQKGSKKLPKTNKQKV